MTDLRIAVGREHIAVTGDCRPEHVGDVGGKAVGLGSLVRAGQRVPDSFVVTAAAYREYLGTRAHPGAQAGQLPGPMRAAIADAYAALGARHGTEVTVAVRSSATVEDSAEASWAGQFQTYLGVAGAAEVLAKVEECWAAAQDPHVGAYRAGQQPGADGGVAVIVQELVDARAAGVMFTQHPETGDRSLIVIESSFGLGEAVVGGDVAPDLFEINKITGLQHRSRLGTKHHQHRLLPGGRGVEVVPVDPDRQGDWSISEAEVMALAAMAAELEAKLGRGLDLEWAIGAAASTRGEEALFALQVRPITVRPRQAAAATPHGDAIGHILGRLAGRPAEGHS